jgi:replicative DNA helicase
MYYSSYMIYSLEIEKQVLAAFIQKPKVLVNFIHLIGESDFYDGSLLHRTLFAVLKRACEQDEQIDEIVLVQRIKDLGIKFEEDLSLIDYVRSLSMRKIHSEEKIESSIKELKKYSVRREIQKTAQKIADSMKRISPDTSYLKIVECADQIYNEKINLFEVGSDTPENIYEEMENFIEERGNNPLEEFGMMGPHEKINDIYGSLLRPGNITVIVARSGVGKTQFCMDYATKVSARYDVPVLHFDNGEMSKEELIIRQCAALSGVPAYLLESGKWRQAGEETVTRVRSVWNKVKNLKFYYYNVGGMDVDSMINTLKRFYYSKVGRGNKMVFSFDYIKTSSDSGSANKNEWQLVGEMVDKFKKCIQKEILEEGLPVIPMITSVQSNRSGITTNRQSANIIDDESIVSLSDRITQFCSHMFILRQKTNDEVAEEGNQFGTHKLINVKARHLGKDIAGAVEPVQVGDNLRKNFINLGFKNFNITECGDLRDIVTFRNTGGDLIGSQSDQIPSFDDL